MLSTTIALYFNRVLNSKDIYCCARLKLFGRNSKSFCSSQDLSLFILPCRMRQIKETKALKHPKENAYSWEWLKLSIVSLKDENFRPTVVLWRFDKGDLRSLYWFVSNSNLDYLGFIWQTKNLDLNISNKTDSVPLTVNKIDSLIGITKSQPKAELNNYLQYKYRTFKTGAIYKGSLYN